jgi:hypothetical protein
VRAAPPAPAAAARTDRGRSIVREVCRRGPVTSIRGMLPKADSRLAEFLRRVLAGDNDVAPVDVIFGPDATTEVQRSLARQFSSSVRDMGYIAPADGADGDLQRVRVTPQGREWLDGYEQRSPALHPRFSS